MTKCRIHPYEFGPGVCAPCLRERLLAIVAAMEAVRSSEPPLPPPIAASPFAIRRRSTGSGPSLPRTHHRFFCTPQVGPTSNHDRDANSKKGSSILSFVFGSGSRSAKNRRSTSGSWISGLFPRWRSKSVSSFPVTGRGMSPDRDDVTGPESPTGWRRPEPTPVRKIPPASPARGGIAVAGFAMCLSPLVRPNPKPASDVGFVGSSDPRAGGAAVCRRLRREVSLEPCRSRKLADIGRFR